MARRDDFQDNNILSYVYEAKQHKSYAYDQQKEANIAKIMEKFPPKDKLEEYYKHTLAAQEAALKDGPRTKDQAAREAARKKKEMEAKLF